MVFSISHKTILPQQMHNAVHIIIMHLNIMRVLATHCRAKCAQLNIYTPQEKGIVQKTYTLIYYTLKMHLYAVYLPLILPSLSPVFSHVGGSTGHPAMPHQYAYW